jgi:hypothetical protein
MTRVRCEEVTRDYGPRAGYIDLVDPDDKGWTGAGVVEQVTIDTNIVLEFWFDQAESEAIRELLRLRNAGDVDLAITSTVHRDAWFGELAA